MEEEIVGVGVARVAVIVPLGVSIATCTRGIVMVVVAILLALVAFALTIVENDDFVDAEDCSGAGYSAGE